MRKPLTIRLIEILSLATIFFVPLVFSNEFPYGFIATKTFLFYIMVEMGFFLWIYNFFRRRISIDFRNPILISGGLFLFLYMVAGFLGIDPAESFGSSIWHMSGLVTLFHIAVFILLLSSVFRTRSDWSKVFHTVVSSGILAALVSYLSYFDFNPFPSLIDISSSTIGNTSYLASYLLFVFFFSLLGCVGVRGRKKVFFLGAAIIILSSPVFVNLTEIKNIFVNPDAFLGLARAGSIAVIWGIMILFAILLSQYRLKIVALLSKLIALILIVTAVFFVVTLPVEDSFVRNTVSKYDIGSRAIFWNASISGIQDRPLFGWGQENFSAVLNDNFDSKILTEKYGAGSEINPSKPHNVFIEIAVSGGLASLLFYLFFVFTLVYALIRKFVVRKDQIPEIAVLSALLVAYFIQASFLFDTITSYLMLSVLVSYLININSVEIQRAKGNYPVGKFLINGYFAGILSLGIFALTFYYLFYLPMSQQIKLQNLISESSIQERSESYDELLSMTPFGKKSTMTFLNQKIFTIVTSVYNQLDERDKKFILIDIHNLSRAQFSYIDSGLKSHYLIFSLTQLLNLEYVMQTDPNEKEVVLDLLEKYEGDLFLLSDNNPANYWQQAQRLAFVGDVFGARASLDQAKMINPDLQVTNDMIESIEDLEDNPRKVPLFIF